MADTRSVVAASSVALAVLCAPFESSTTITVPVPNHRELDRGTLRSIIRQSQLDRELFEAD